jgi:hypothetical protein
MSILVSPSWGDIIGVLSLFQQFITSYMSEQLKEESQKTVVSFVVGLLVGGLLVWAFTGNNSEAPKKEMTDDKSEMTSDKEAATQEEVGTDEEGTTSVPVGEGAVSVAGDAAGMSVSLADVTFPAAEGWVGVRNLNDGKLGMILGVARFSAEQGLNPKEIQLLTPTVAGREYAIVFYSESGDRKFNLAEDVQMEGEFAKFVAK